MLEFNGTRYTGDVGESDNLGRINDELMIANMLNFLTNPTFSKLLADDELKTMLQVVKNHVVTKAEHVLKVQSQYNGRIAMIERERQFRKHVKL